MNKYIGHPSQLFGVEEHRLIGGKGDGMRLLVVRNGKGLEFTVSADRCADLSRLSFKGDNFSYFAPCGYIAPHFYDGVGNGFLKSFTAGFLTTCGLTAVGSPCTDQGESLPMHGTIANTPSEQILHWIEKDEIHIKATVRDAALFSQQLMLTREYICPLTENTLQIIDTVQNIGPRVSPFMMLYHFNFGYPLLNENTVISIPSKKIIPRNSHAAEGIENCLKMEQPQRGFEEQCYYHQGVSKAAIFNSEISKGLRLEFDNTVLPYFTEWKMMGESEYVLGLEPGNCTPDGRDVMRNNHTLRFLQPNETAVHHIKVTIFEDDFEEELK